MGKFLTTSEAETKRQQAITFLNRIGKEDEAARFEEMDAEDYAASKGAELIDNPSKKDRRKTMARGKSKAELEAELDESNSYIEELESKLDDIVGIAAESADEDDEEEEDDDDSDEDNGGDPN